ncbi:MAG: hypothetical protein WC718_01445 [Phycisphaerales bacterium]|jgi:hypothetical protein
MALTTYGGLITALPLWATYTDLSAAQLADFVTWADQEIARRLRSNVLLASTSLTLSAETIAQPTGFLAFRRLYLDTSPRRVIATVSPEGAMDLSAQFASSTYPTHVAVEGSLLRFAPVHTGTTTTATALYYKRQTAMSGDSDTNVVLTAYPYLYLYGALEALFSFKEDDNMADRYGQKFGALIEDINNRDAKDMMSGPIQSAPYPGGVI